MRGEPGGSGTPAKGARLHRAAAAWLWLVFIVCVGLWGLWARDARAQAADAVCAEVKIVIGQKFSLERQAFDARMVITNGLAGQRLENVSIELRFLDANNGPVAATTDPNAAGAAFFFRTDEVTGISALDGGTIVPKTVANIGWLIIPAAGSGGRSPEGAVYYVGAKGTYTLDGKTDTVDVVPEAIVVRPQPELVLDYFLPGDVHADDPFTPETEAAEPFTLGVRIGNQGGGTSHATRIETAQPRIVENRQGLAVSFQILGGYVADQPAGKSLLLDFGDIAPGTAAMGRWFMVASLAGKFVEFAASFTHADSLGGAATSLIKDVRTHTLLQDVRVDLPGRDKVRDFLARDGDVRRVYESDGADTEVQDQTASAHMQVQGAGATLGFNAVPQGFAYARVPDPHRGAKAPARVTRSDGYIVPAENVWLSKERNANLSWSYFLNIFDANTTGQYTIGFVAGTAQSSLGGMVYRDANANGLREPGEPGIPVAQIKLTGTQAGTGASELQTAYTDAQGGFSFTNLQPGVYALEVGVADGHVDGPALAGSAGGRSEAGRLANIELAAGTAAAGYLFSKRTALPDATDTQPTADLKVTLGAAPATVKAGGTSALTVAAGNLGPDTARAVAVNIELPAGLAVQSQSATAGSYANGVWTLGDVAKDAAASLTLQVQVAGDATAREFAVSARIGSSTRDDVAGNNSASTLLNIQDDAGVTAVQSIDQGVRILAYVGCGADQACAARKRQAAHAALSVHDAGIGIAATAADFRQALRAGDFSVLWLGGLLSDLDEDLQEEVRAAVVRGACLVVDGTADAGLRGLADMWGGYAGQPLAGAALQIGATQVPLSAPGWPLEPSAGATVPLRYATGQAAAVRAAHGKGQVLALGFDPFADPLGGTAWTDWLAAQVASSTPGLADPMLAQSAVRVRTVVTNHGDATRQVTLSTTLGNGVALVSAQPAATQDSGQLSWPMDIAAHADKVVELWLRLPSESRAFAVESRLRDGADASELDRWPHAVRTVASPEAEAEARAALAAMQGIADGQRAALAALLDQAAAAAQRQEYGAAIGSLVQAHQGLRALAQDAARERALQSAAQWMGLVSASWKDDGGGAPGDWILAASGGSHQLAQVGTVFGAALQVRLVDGQGAGVAGRTITFELPSGGASALFAGGVPQAQAQTDADGFASSPSLTANGVEGSFQAVATATGVAGAVQFTLSNTAAPVPVLSLRAISGGGQSAVVGAAFASAVRVQLVDGQGGAVAGRSIVFSLPAQGAGASFAGGALSAQAQTDAQGMAVSPRFTANATAGDFEMAAAAGAAQVRVGLKNLAVPAGDRQVSITTPTGTGVLKASVSGGGASCRFDSGKTAVKKPEGLLPLVDALFFPHGVFEYELIGCDVGSTVTVATQWPSLLGVSNYLKYGPTPGSRGKKLWYVPENLKLQGDTVSYTITDGQLGDDDLAANGVIKDPGGPVILGGPLPGATTAVPGLTPLAAALLSLLVFLGWCGCQRRRRRRDAAKHGAAHGA